jgi:hypothetical protein
LAFPSSHLLLSPAQDRHARRNSFQYFRNPDEKRRKLPIAAGRCATRRAARRETPAVQWSMV